VPQRDRAASIEVDEVERIQAGVANWCAGPE
jgi:hypothetical protein